MIAKLDTITVAIQKATADEWPAGLSRLVLEGCIGEEFDLIEVNEPHDGGTWDFTLREQDPVAVVKRINEMIQDLITE